ncbi:MAG: helix-turn-helix domain-containing protein [Flavobacteriales bacterium]
MLSLNIPFINQKGKYNSIMHTLHVDTRTIKAHKESKAKSINLTLLTQLCTQLHCTPNDILQYQPNPSQTLPPAHPLHALKPHPQPNIIQTLPTLTPDQIKQIQQIIQQQPQ